MSATYYYFIDQGAAGALFRNNLNFFADEFMSSEHACTEWKGGGKGDNINNMKFNGLKVMKKKWKFLGRFVEAV